MHNPLLLTLREAHFPVSVGVQEVISRTKCSKNIECEPNNAENEEATSFGHVGWKEVIIEDIESLASTNLGEIISTHLFYQLSLLKEEQHQVIRE